MCSPEVPVTLEETIEYLLILLDRIHLKNCFTLLPIPDEEVKRKALEIFGAETLHSYWVQDHWLFKMLPGLQTARNFYELSEIWAVLTGEGLTAPLYCLVAGRRSGRVQPMAYTHGEITYLLEHRQKLDPIFLPAQVAVEVIIYWVLRPQRQVQNHKERYFADLWG